MLSPYASVVEKLHKDTDKEKVTMLKIERAGDVLADAPAKVAQSLLLFCKGQGLLTSVVMPGVDRQRAFSTSSGGSNGEPRRLSRGKSWECTLMFRTFESRLRKWFKNSYRMMRPLNANLSKAL